MIDFRKMEPLRKGYTRYAVYAGLLSRSEKLGEVRQVDVDRNPWSDRPPSRKWAAYRVDGERIALASTRGDAAEALVAR